MGLSSAESPDDTSFFGLIVSSAPEFIICLILTVFQNKVKTYGIEDWLKSYPSEGPYKLKLKFDLRKLCKTLILVNVSLNRHISNKCAPILFFLSILQGAVTLTVYLFHSSFVVLFIYSFITFTSNFYTLFTLFNSEFINLDMQAHVSGVFFKPSRYY